MAGEPSYPEDAPVGGKAEAEARGAEPARKGGEAVAAVEAAKASSEGAGRTRGLVTGAAIGIGSAALVAALLYARNRNRGGEADGK